MGILPTVPDKNLAREFLDVVPRAMRAVRTEMRSVASQDMSVPHFRILAHLFRHGKTNQRELAENLGTNPPSMCRLIASLRKRDLVRETRNELDRREVLVELNDTGRDTFLSYQASAANRIQVHLDQLPPEDQLALRKGLDLMSRLFEVRS